MLHRRVVATVLLVSALGAVPASAQFMPRVFCPSGQASCFAAAFNYSNYATGLPGHSFLDGIPLTVLSLYVQNLQGSYTWTSPDPFSVNTMGFFRQNAGFDDLSSSLFVNLIPRSTNPPRSGAAFGPVRVGTDPFLSESQDADPINNLSTIYSSDIAGGVMGCDLGKYDSPLYGWGWQTCPSQGLTGWVKFDYALWWAEQAGVSPKFVTGQDFFLTLGAAGTDADYLCGYGVKIGIDPDVEVCPDFAYTDPIVTPEPATILLLATGMAGVAGAVRARRRRMFRS